MIYLRVCEFIERKRKIFKQICDHQDILKYVQADNVGTLLLHQQTGRLFDKDVIIYIECVILLGLNICI